MKIKKLPKSKKEERLELYRGIVEAQIKQDIKKCLNKKKH